MAKDDEIEFGSERDVYQGDYDPDYDEKPGSFENTPSYDLRYNPTAENEWTNLLEKANQIELANLQREAEVAQDRKLLAMMDLQSQVQFMHGVGKFIVPAENTWAAHFDLVGYDDTELDFSTHNYPLFDGLVAKYANIPALTDPNHPDYPSYEGLRDNISVLRNYLLTDTFQDGSFDPGDEKLVPRITSIAEEIGRGLSQDKWLARIFHPSINTHVAKIEGEGAAEIYDYLLSRQNKHSMLGDLIAGLMTITGATPHYWDLPDVQNTPFSDENLSSPPPNFHQTRASAITQQHAQQNEPTKAQGNSSPAAESAQALAGALQDIANQLQRGKARQSVDSMSGQARDESVELGREILDRLRNMQFDDRATEALLDQAAPKNERESESFNPAQYGRSQIDRAQKVQDVRSQKTVRHAQKVAQIIEIYEQYLDMALQFNPALLHHERIKESNKAVEEYKHSIQLMAAMEIPNSIAAAQQIGAEATLDPARWDELHQNAASRLMTSIEGGMEEALSSMEQQEMDQERENDELAESALEAALLHSDQARRKRRRKRKHISGYGAKSQLRKHLDLTADDYVLKQGRFRDNDDNEPDAPKKVPAQPRSGDAGDPLPPNLRDESLPPGLRYDDVDNFRQASESLRRATEQGRGLEESQQRSREQEANEQASSNPALPSSATQAITQERERSSRRNKQI